MNKPFFSIVIPTRNRANLFARALNSIACQQTESLFVLEVVVVNDGSSKEQLKQYETILAATNIDTQLLNLRFRERGHGPSFARNEGAQLSQGQFICFLDDDDEWTDKHHLLRLFKFIDEHSCSENSVFLFQQVAQKADGSIVEEELWNRDLVSALDISDYSRITKKIFSKSQGFTHLNCLVCAKDLFVQMGGFDEGLRYEEDRDFNFRLIDNADAIYLFNRNVAKHYIPDRSKRNNASTALIDTDKTLLQLCADIKLVAMIEDDDLRRSIERHLVYTVERLNASLNSPSKRSLFIRILRGIKLSSSWIINTVTKQLLKIRF